MTKIVAVVGFIIVSAALSSATLADWSRQIVTGPSARTDAAMAYDPTRSRIVLFGGINLSGVHFGDTWEWDGTAWEQRLSTGPSPRNSATMAYDSISQKVILFGGHSGTAFLGDTWAWDGTNWTLLDVGGPAPRNGAAMVLDTARNRVVLFGGNGGPFGDTWEWDGDSWTQMSTSGPDPRLDHAMAYDPNRQRVVLFGGFASNSVYGDTWEWDGTAWTKRLVSGPAPRNGHMMAYDACRDRIVLFGGVNGTNVYFGDTWEWDGNSWADVSTAGPAARASPAMAYDGARGNVVLFGGSGGPVNFDDTWEFDGSSSGADLRYGRPLFGSLCTGNATHLTQNVYDRLTIGVCRATDDRFYLSSEGTAFSPLVVDDAVHMNGAGIGLGPYSYQAGVPPFVLGVPIEQNLHPLPSHEVTTHIPSGSSLVLFELLDTQRAIYGHTPVYLLQDCGVWLSGSSPTAINWMSHDEQITSSAPDFDVRFGRLSHLHQDHDFSRASCLGRSLVTPMLDNNPDPPIGDGYYYLARSTQPGSCNDYGQSSVVPDPRDGLDDRPPCP